MLHVSLGRMLTLISFGGCSRRRGSRGRRRRGGWAWTCKGCARGWRASRTLLPTPHAASRAAGASARPPTTTATIRATTTTEAAPLQTHPPHLHPPIWPLPSAPPLPETVHPSQRPLSRPLAGGHQRGVTAWLNIKRQQGIWGLVISGYTKG